MITQICTSAEEGQTLGGCFHFAHGNLSTECIPHDAESSVLQSIIEDGLNTEPVDGPGPLPSPRSGRRARGNEEDPWVPGLGRVNVSTDGVVDDVGGRCWNVTFSSAVGAVGPMTILTAPSGSASASVQQQQEQDSGNKLSGLGAAVTVETLQVGIALAGNFSLKIGGGETARLPVTATALAVSEALLELPGVEFAHATRTNPVASCGDGLCSVGQTPGGGLEWTVQLGTRVGNAEPSSPTAAVGRWGEGTRAMEEGEFDWPEVVGFLEGDGAMVSLKQGWAGSADQLRASFNASRPFSIALGGVGASHGEPA